MLPMQAVDSKAARLVLERGLGVVAYFGVQWDLVAVEADVSMCECVLFVWSRWEMETLP